MGKVSVHSFSTSLDGFSAGPNQSLDNPLGERGGELFEWFFPTRVFQQMHGASASGETGTDNSIAEDGFKNVGAWILGRNMFGPVRGDWPDDSWKGWWGDEPPYHVPVFVLTHYPRESITMRGGTVFHFVTQGVDSALAQAQQAANGKDVRVGGGVATIRQFLKARHLDELHLAVRPMLFGSGENLFEGMDLRALGYQCVKHIPGERAVHVYLEKVG